MVYEKFQSANNALGHLLALIGASATTMILDAGEGDLYPDHDGVTDNDYLLTLEERDSLQAVLKREIVRVTAKAGDTFTIVRSAGYCPASDGATTQTNTAFSFPAGSYVFMNNTAENDQDVKNEIDNINNDITTIENTYLTVADYITGAKLYSESNTGNDSYQITLSGVTSYAGIVGQEIRFKADVGNTGNATFQINALGAKNIRKMNDVPLETGDIEAGMFVILLYNDDDDVFEMVSASARPPTVAVSDILGNLFTYGETITAADLVHFQNDGKVYKWDGYASAASNWITGSYTSKAAMCFIDTDKVVVVYKPSGAGQTLICKVGTISGETVTRGTPANIHVGIDGSTNQREICKHDTNAFTVAYWDSTTLSVRAVTVSGTTPTVGSAVTVNSVTTNTLQTSVDICSPDTGKICVAYICGAATADIRGRVGTISGTVVSFGTEVVALSSNGAWASVCKLDTDKVLLGGVGTGSDIVSYVGTITGTAISFGSQAITAATATNSGFMQVETNVAVIGYSDTNLKAMYVTSSGTANTHRTAVTISTALGATYKKSCMLGTGQIVFVSDTDNLIYTIKDTTNYTFEIVNTIDYGAKAGLNIDLRFSTMEQYTLNRIFVCSFDSVGSTNNAYFLNNNARYLLGIAQESGVLNDNKYVALPGNISTVNAGLTAGEKYFTDNYGAYTLNPSGVAYAGKALSATSMLVGINNSIL